MWIKWWNDTQKLRRRHRYRPKVVSIRTIGKRYDMASIAVKQVLQSTTMAEVASSGRDLHVIDASTLTPTDASSSFQVGNHQLPSSLYNAIQSNQNSHIVWRAGSSAAACAAAPAAASRKVL